MSIRAKLQTSPLSIRISLMVVFSTALLLSVALFIMFRYARKAMREEALQKAEQTLEATVQHIDNVLLSVEQSAGNVYADMLNHLNQPERMFVYSRKLVETNAHIAGCAIAFDPYYYKDRGQYFMAYVHRTSTDGLHTTDSPIIQSETFGNVPYTEQVWFTTPMQTGKPCWINPLKDQDTEGDPIVTFSLPIYDHGGKRIGVLAVDVSLVLLSDIVLAAKPSPNSYATLLGSDGSFIVHPDSSKLLHQTAFTQTRKGADPSVAEAVQAMVAGETGYKRVFLNGTDNYVFYKPFKRSLVPGRFMEDLGWSAGIVYPENDIFGDYNHLLYVVLSIAGAGLLLLFLLCRTITYRQLKPLRLLTRSAQRIAEGHYDEPIPESHQQDEVGRLQDHFLQMQQSLAGHVGELQRLTATLREQGKVLEEAYHQAKEADRMKTAFLHHMTNQMMAPVNDVCNCVSTLCQYSQSMEQAEASQLADTIQQQGSVLADLLNNLLEVSQKEEMKEK